MKKNKKRILTIVIIAISLITMFLPTIVNATNTPVIPKPTPPSDPNLSTLAEKILGYAQWLGILVAVVMIVFYGIKYFTAAPEKQGELKKAMWGYLLGAVAIFGASLILGFISKALSAASEGLNI